MRTETEMSFFDPIRNGNMREKEGGYEKKRRNYDKPSAGDGDGY